jgi:hypothetical protein
VTPYYLGIILSGLRKYLYDLGNTYMSGRGVFLYNLGADARIAFVLMIAHTGQAPAASNQYDQAFYTLPKFRYLSGKAG